MKSFRALTLLFFGLLLASSRAQAVTIDGAVGDWGVNPGPYGSSDWVPSSGVVYTQEDQNPAVDYLNPGYGGQGFDVEAMYFQRDTTFAYFAIISGFPLEGRIYGGAPYYAGDVAFDFGADGSYEFGLETGAANRGKLYGNPTWNQPLFTVCGPYDIATGTLLGSVAFGYDKTSYLANGHYAFEFAIPISYFGSFWGDPSGTPKFNMHWTMSCGNDCLELNVPADPARGPNIPLTPEPSTYVLLTLGLLGLAAARKFRLA